VYQWERIEDAKAFYAGPWLDGIVQRYGMKPQIEFYEVFAVTDNASGKVEVRALWSMIRKSGNRFSLATKRGTRLLGDHAQTKR
jgi:hypothetical protein